MAYLVKCLTCHGKVSTNANFCPHCGEVEFLPHDASPPIELPEIKPDKRRVAARTVVITFAAIAFLAMVLYPPWAEVRSKVSMRYEKKPIPIEQLDRHYFTHRSLLSNEPSQPNADQPKPQGAMFDETTYQIHWQLLMLQWLALLVPTFIVLILLRDKPVFIDRFATEARPAAEEQPVMAGKRQEAS